MSKIAFTEDESLPDEGIIERPSFDRGARRADDEDEFPLFPTIRQDARKTIHHIKVYRMDPPDHGFKGEVPPAASLNDIALTYGNGLYNFEACLETGKALRRSHGVRINVPLPKKDLSSEAVPLARPAPEMQLLQWQAEQAKEQNSRLSDMSEHTMTALKDTSQSHIEAMRTLHTTSTDRDREFFRGMMESQQGFFASILSQQTQAHQQSLERQRLDHEQSMERARMNAPKPMDPMMTLRLIQQGMALALPASTRDDDDDGDGEDGDDDSPWGSAIRDGVGALKDVTEMFKAKALNDKAGAAVKAITSNAPETPTPTPARKRKRRPFFERSQVEKMARIKKVLSEKGIDFDSALDNIMVQLSSEQGAADEPTNESDATTEQAEDTAGPPEGDDIEPE